MSPHTLHSCRDSHKLLLQFVAGKKRDPSQLIIQQLTFEQVMSFLQHLEASRRNQVSTRNVRLSAIHSFFRYVGAQNPQFLAQAQRILNIPFKRTALREIEHLEFAEIQFRVNKRPLGFVEGLNNQIRQLQQRACGYRDEEYFRLKILTSMLPKL